MGTESPIYQMYAGTLAVSLVVYVVAIAFCVFYGLFRRDWAPFLICATGGIVAGSVFCVAYFVGQFII